MLGLGAGLVGGIAVGSRGPLALCFSVGSKVGGRLLDLLLVAWETLTPLAFVPSSACSLSSLANGGAVSVCSLWVWFFFSCISANSNKGARSLS